MRPRLAVAVALLCTSMAAPAVATVSPGDVAPNFTKNQLDFPALGQVTPRSLADWPNKVIIFFLLGYS